jgi:sporulation protein YlmC with PRC-barrel domain
MQAQPVATRGRTGGAPRFDACGAGARMRTGTGEARLRWPFVTASLLAQPCGRTSANLMEDYMRQNHLVVALLGTALLTLPAYAQTSPGAGNQPAASSGSMGQSGSGAASPSGTSAQAPAARPSATGSQAATPAGRSGNVQFMSQAQPGQWRASKLVGVDVYGQNNEKIGDVNDVLMDANGNAQAVVIGVGGFLGIGEKDVALPFNAVQWSSQPRQASASGTSRDGSPATTGTTPGTARTTNTNNTMAAGATPNRDAPDHVVLNMTKEQLQNAPAFKYASDQDSGNTRR